ncbi:MAG: hypothetical protein OXE85_01375 [Roseovarius sp.]|nr:hypothetical protein [Roseovarius sp.]
MSEELNSKILAAHCEKDIHSLIRLYIEASKTTGNHDEECFFLTNAYICALETGSSETKFLHDQLRKYGREI